MENSFEKFYDALCAWCQSQPAYAFKGGKFFKDAKEVDPPKTSGIYIMWDIKENRIVRIGSATKSLLDRLNRHFKRTKRVSVFRKLVGDALIIRDNLGGLDWNDRDTKYPDIEKEVTKYLEENIKFYLCEITDKKEVLAAEKAFIVLLSLYYKTIGQSRINANWLGKNSSRDKVKNSGLWNNVHALG